MARPKSMPDFSHLLLADASTPSPHVPEKERPRKKPSISLAAGLIMASESPRSVPNTPQQTQGKNDATCSDNLFYAYAQKSDYAQSPPFILTFSSASIASQWWDLVKQEYPESTREGAQLFVLKGDDMQEQIQDNPKFYNLRNKWFYTPSDGTMGVIPLQDYRGNPVSTTTSPAPQKKPSISINGQGSPGFDLSKLSDTLEKMTAMISSNSSQIKALSVAQSEGLQRMQEINESNSTQIKALADGQFKLQALTDQNASHYIALSNSSFQNQEQVKDVLQTNAQQIQALAEGQGKLADTCNAMMKTIEDLGGTVGKVGETVSQLAVSDTSSSAAFSSSGNRISPPPRKLNRRIKGVWYEYD
ncbi:uncharacterized protein BDR25DRAFT_254606, partial [Lindgomyces ingoldianus]